ncbi:MAG: DUF5683 domain-containing protein [Bacteroidales bacterium]
MRLSFKITILILSVWMVAFPLSAQEISVGERTLSADSIRKATQPFADSIRTLAPRLAEMQTDTIRLDSVRVPKKISKKDVKPIKEYKPFVSDPTKAVWYSALFPGLGQVYNRKYWKLPIVYGGFAATFYALNWNTQYLKDYSQAYLDFMDNDPNTKSYEDIIPPSMINSSNKSQIQNILKRQKDMFRRNRDLSIISMLGVYLLSVVDAYVDAQLFDFDITPDLSMRVEPTVIIPTRHNSKHGVGIQWSINF